MASLKSIRKKEQELENLEAESKATAPVVAEENEYINEDEKKALSAQVAEDEAKSKEISIQKMASVVECVQEQFHLADKNYVVNGFVDKGNKSQISLSNEDFDIVITIKDNEKFGIS